MDVWYVLASSLSPRRPKPNPPTRTGPLTTFYNPRHQNSSTFLQASPKAGPCSEPSVSLRRIQTTQTPANQRMTIHTKTPNPVEATPQEFLELDALCKCQLADMLAHNTRFLLLQLRVLGTNRRGSIASSPPRVPR